MKALPVGFFAQVDKVKSLGQEIWFTYQVGRIVGQVNSVEKYVDNIIAGYYAGENYQTLKTDVIEAMTLDAKISLIKKIATSLGIAFSRTNKSDLYRWKEIRNTVAHGVPLHTGDPGAEDNEIVLVYDDNIYDIDELSEDFFSRQHRLTDYLGSIQDKLPS